jgi:hypothetical protein
MARAPQPSSVPIYFLNRAISQPSLAQNLLFRSLEPQTTHQDMVHPAAGSMPNHEHFTPNHGPCLKFLNSGYDRESLQMHTWMASSCDKF